ncbi:MAG TPA: toll/interleukin-1 receptor domain-containing protein [Candidatus Aquilonibacter sp.]|nr:toll/interleukin-1 receptor domain-containing protein [Candidatus Aquilonibacter sp.]
MTTEFKYWAFISYSHQDNRKHGNLWGDWLHDAVENFKVPPELVGRPGRYDEPVPARLFPAFQDEKELPTNADLGVAIKEALDQSRYLVVICSPRSAKSIYVNQEVLEFKRLGRANRILAIIVDGEPNASEPSKGFDPALECFPDALRHPLGADGKLDLTQHTEPIAADVRGADGKRIIIVDTDYSVHIRNARTGAVLH